jgi:hypothetical protein
MQTTITPENAADAADLLRALGRQVTVEASAVTQSPFPYVYVWTDDRNPEARYAIVSDLTEWEDAPGILVGVRDHYEDDGTPPDTVPSVEAAVAWLRERL